MSKEKEELNVYIIKVEKESEKTRVEEWILIIQDTVIHTGTWMTNVEDYTQGVLTGLKIANLNPKLQTIDIKNDKEYERVSRGEIDLERIAKMAGLI